MRQMTGKQSISFAKAVYIEGSAAIVGEKERHGTSMKQEDTKQGNQQKMQKETDRKSTRLNSSHMPKSRMPSSA